MFAESVTLSATCRRATTVHDREFFIARCLCIRREEDPQFDMNRADTEYVRNASFAVGTLFESKWRIQILCALRSRPVRLGQLTRLIPKASKKMLVQNLRQLEADGIVIRKDMSDDLVLHIEYELNEDTSERLCALLDHLAEWGELYLKRSYDQRF